MINYTSIPDIHETSYLTIYEWEKCLDFDGLHQWMVVNWASSIYASMIYIVFIFGTQYYMQNRKPFRLTGPLTFWNLGLTFFSIMVFIRTLPEFIKVLTSTQDGFHNTLCQWTHHHNYATVFWSYLFMISKLVELGDTVFIVLRKQKLIFLHWYHHIMTLVAASRMAVDYEPHLLWYIVMNSFIHSFMYSYYALKAAGVKVPRSWAMTITAMQLVQMVLGVLVNVYAFDIMWWQGKESECARGYFGLKLASGVAISYLVLFAHFFYASYIKPSKVSFNKRNIDCTSRNGYATKKVD